MEKKKVYIAGPDVFYPDAVARGKRYVQLAAEKGLIGLFPLDNEINQTPVDYHIYLENKKMIDSADAVVANLMDFRGLEPDSGTVWELAYAFAKGKVVVAYSADSGSILERAYSHTPESQVGMVVESEEGTNYYDKEGMLIENFNNPFNLMIQHSATAIVIGDYEDALEKVAELLQKN